jgi:hypothetical protein
MEVEREGGAGESMKVRDDEIGYWKWSGRKQGTGGDIDGELGQERVSTTRGDSRLRVGKRRGIIEQTITAGRDSDSVELVHTGKDLNTMVFVADWWCRIDDGWATKATKGE